MNKKDTMYKIAENTYRTIKYKSLFLTKLDGHFKDGLGVVGQKTTGITFNIQ